jgi:transposase
MKYARIHVLPETPPGGLTAGIDWGSADHAVCVVDAAGQVRARFTVAHDRAGIGKLIAGLRAAGVSEAAIERGDGPLVEALLEAGLTVVVVTSRQMKNLRSRYGSAGAKDDRFDAFVLADVLRTDRARLRPLVVDTPATAALRAAVRARRDLVAHRIAACNQLRAHLAVAFPGAVGLFAHLDSQISLAFLARFGSQDAAGPLGEDELAAWLRTLPSRGNPATPGQLRDRLHAAPRGATGTEGTARAAVTAALVATLTTLAAQIKALEAEIAAQLAAHPDAHIFTSLPRAGTVRAARLLAETGDCRARFPDPESLAALAGVAPVTRRSGKHTSVGFRWAVNRQLRDAVCDFAADSRHASPWAAAIYHAARARGKDHPHAVRILARAWTYVIWRCWQDGTAYDPAKHRALQRTCDQQQAADPAAADTSTPGRAR